MNSEYIEPKTHMNLPPSDPVQANTTPIDPLTALGITLPVTMLYRAERAEFLLTWVRENPELSDEAKLSLERRVVETDGVWNERDAVTDVYESASEPGFVLISYTIGGEENTTSFKIKW